ncbi:hypothetical protein [Paraburkholderia sp.]|uniref:hypothetical protein n=1 Tax=Paraburkholderia sp. TaxID=1926495 RepID=UPI002F3F76FA
MGRLLRLKIEVFFLLRSAGFFWGLALFFGFFCLRGALGGLPAALGLLWFWSVGFGVWLFGCLPAGLAFPCIFSGLLASAFDCLPAALAFPCILVGLLASPLCGAAPVVVQ